MNVVGVTESTMPLREKLECSRNRAIPHEAELIEQALLRVAVTQTRCAALVTTHRPVSRWIRSKTLLSQGG